MAISSPSVRARVSKLCKSQVQSAAGGSGSSCRVVSLSDSWKRSFGDYTVDDSFQSKETPTSESIEGYKGACGKCRCACPISALL